jgi:Tfp pilus assembly protein PilF
MSLNPIPSPADAVPATLQDNLRSMRLPKSLSQTSQEQAYALGYGWLQSREYDKARAAFETLWQQCPDEARYAAGVAHSALGQGQGDVAMAYFLLAVGLDENNPGYMLGLSRAFLANRYPGHAREGFELAEAMAEQAQDKITADMARACLQLMERSA